MIFAFWRGCGASHFVRPCSVMYLQICMGRHEESMDFRCIRHLLMLVIACISAKQMMRISVLLQLQYCRDCFDLHIAYQCPSLRDPAFLHVKAADRERSRPKASHPDRCPVTHYDCEPVQHTRIDRLGDLQWNAASRTHV